MEKKKETAKVEEPIVEETVVMEKPVIETPKVSIKPQKKENVGLESDWEIKHRLYRLTRGKSPLSYIIKACDIYYFDEQKGYQRELKYCKNQKTCFVDEMKGDQRLEHIVFRDGTLFVPREQQTLQKLLSLYHPHRGNLFEEVDKVKSAESELDMLEFEVNALQAAMSVEIDVLEAIMRVQKGSKVSKMSSKEIKRDALLFAKKNPMLFLELLNDGNTQLRNFGIKATELGIISLSQDQRTFSWTENKRKLMTVPFGEHPYSALAQWFKTDEGTEIYSNIEKRIN